MRILLESEAAARAASNGMEVKDLLTRLYEMQEHLDEMNRENYEQLNSDIHTRIWEAADNEKLKRYLMELWNGPSTGHSMMEATSHYKNSTFEHISILHFIRDKKIDEARKAMKQHIKRSMENIMKKYPESL